MKAAGYFRRPVSVNDPDSLSHQQRAFLDFTEAQGFEVVATFTEEHAATATPAFNSLIDFLKRPDKGFVIVVVGEPAVLSDDIGTAAGRCLEIERLGGRVQFISGEPDTLDALVAAWENGASAAIGERVRTAMHRKAVRGEVLGRPPYGYHIGARNRLELIEDEAVVVRYIFRLYLQEDLGIRLIARRLNEEGLHTRRGRPWSMVSIRDILRNRVYLGTYQRLGVRVPGTHPALVSPDDFRRVQDRMGERRTNYSPRIVSPFLLSGLVQCGECGNKLIGVSRHQSWKRRGDGSERAATYRYYQCESRTNQGICGYHTRRAEELEQEVRSYFLNFNPRSAEAGDDAAVTREWNAEVAKLRERLHQIDRRIARSLDAAAGDRISRARLRSDGIGLAEERLHIEDELRAAEWRAQHFNDASERRRVRKDAVTKLVDQWETLTVQGKQDLLRDVISHIRVVTGGLEVELRP